MIEELLKADATKILAIALCLVAVAGYYFAKNHFSRPEKEEEDEEKNYVPSLALQKFIAETVSHKLNGVRQEWQARFDRLDQTMSAVETHMKQTEVKLVAIDEKYTNLYQLLTVHYDRRLIQVEDELRELRKEHISAERKANETMSDIAKTLGYLRGQSDAHRLVG